MPEQDAFSLGDKTDSTLETHEKPKERHGLAKRVLGLNASEIATRTKLPEDLVTTRLARIAQKIDDLVADIEGYSNNKVRPVDSRIAIYDDGWQDPHKVDAAAIDLLDQRGAGFDDGLERIYKELDGQICAVRQFKPTGTEQIRDQDDRVYVPVIAYYRSFGESKGNELQKPGTLIRGLGFATIKSDSISK